MEEGGESCSSHCFIIFLFFLGHFSFPISFYRILRFKFCPWFKFNFPLLFDVVMHDGE